MQMLPQFVHHASLNPVSGWLFNIAGLTYTNRRNRLLIELVGRCHFSSGIILNLVTCCVCLMHGKDWHAGTSLSRCWGWWTRVGGEADERGSATLMAGSLSAVTAGWQIVSVTEAAYRASLPKFTS